MKIADVKITLWEWKDIPPTRYSRLPTSSTLESVQMGLVRIITDEGLEGHAFLGSSFFSAASDAQFLIETYKPWLIGEDPLARERIWQRMAVWAQGAAFRVVGAVDVALWDLAGKAAVVPVHRLMGSYREKLPAYASSAVFDDPQAYVDEATRVKEQNWAAYKIHPPGGAKAAIRICEAVRGAVGDDYRLMLDASWLYDYPDAVRIGHAVQELDFYWYEDPLQYDDLYSYVKLKQALRIPIMATEMPLAGPRSYAPWIMARATDYLRGDVAIKGGLTSCLKTAHLAEAFQMNYEIHHGFNSLNNVACLNLAMALRNTEFFEVLLPDAAQKHGLVRDIVVDAEGFVHAPTGPGLGYEIDFDLIDRNRIGEL